MTIPNAQAVQGIRCHVLMRIENATTLESFQAHFLPLIRRLFSNRRKIANALTDADK
jgi:hypothetical protein